MSNNPGVGKKKTVIEGVAYFVLLAFSCSRDEMRAEVRDFERQRIKLAKVELGHLLFKNY